MKKKGRFLKKVTSKKDLESANLAHALDQGIPLDSLIDRYAPMQESEEEIGATSIRLETIVKSQAGKIYIIGVPVYFINGEPFASAEDLTI